jgi:cysteine-rich repeat protein
VPQNLNTSATSCSTVSLTWNASTDTGGSGLAGYKIYRNGSFLKQVTGTSTTDSGLPESTTFSYQASAIDNAGNESAKSNTAVTNTPSCVFCGNGIVESNEECDDGNSVNGDGCENDCTLTPNSSGGETIWAERFGSFGKDMGLAVAVDHQGNVVVTGQFAYDVDFGGGPLSSSSPYQLTSIFVAKYSPDGTHLWSTSLETGPSADSLGRAIAVDSSNNIIIAGSCMQFLKFNGTKLYGWGLNIPDICIAKFSSSGAHLWAKLMGALGPDQGIGVAVDSNDNVLLTGSFSETVNFGGGPLTGANSSNNIFLVKYSPAGNHLWSKRFGDVTGSVGRSVAVDNNDNILLTGSFSGTVNFGGGSLTGAGSTDVFLVSFSPTGSHRWSKGFGGNSSDGGKSVAVDGIGNVYVTGYFKETANFGGGPLTSAGGKDIFIAKYAPTGNHLWSGRFGGVYDQEAAAIAADGSSDIIVTGSFRHTVDFGGGPLSTFGFMYSDIFIAKLTPTGGHLWSKSFGYGDNDNQASASVAVDSSGNSVVTGSFTGTTDFGTGPLISDGNDDIFLLKLSP